MTGRLNKWFGNIWLLAGLQGSMPRYPGTVQCFLGFEQRATSNGKGGRGGGPGGEAVAPLPVIALGLCSSFDFYGVCVHETESTCSCVSAHIRMYLCIYACAYVCVPV